jgi:hypothetical protein
MITTNLSVYLRAERGTYKLQNKITAGNGVDKEKDASSVKEEQNQCFFVSAASNSKLCDEQSFQKFSTHSLYSCGYLLLCI